MSDIRRRLKKAEQLMNLDKRHTTVIVTMFGGRGKLPPDWTKGNITYRHVSYGKEAKQ
jgi:hypothetical protein